MVGQKRLRVPKQEPWRHLLADSRRKAAFIGTYSWRMSRVTELSAYSDEHGNTIEFSGLLEKKIQIKFTGSNNRLAVSGNAKIAHLIVDFDCDNGLVEIGGSRGVPTFLAAIRVGEDSKVLIGDNVSSTSVVAFSATEGTTVRIGNDVMFASDNEVRADDGHPIFDVVTGKRVNVSRSITIGNHVWLARASVVLGGSMIGDGSVIGYGSIVTKRIPNNCVAAGVPAKVVRTNIAWERPHLSLMRPYYKMDASTVEHSPYWDLTELATLPPRPSKASRLKRRVLRLRPKLNRD